MGHSTSSGARPGATPQMVNVGERVYRAATDFVNHNLPDANWGYATVDSIVDIGYGNVRIEYHGQVRVPYGIDRETGREEYGYETEYGEREISREELMRRVR